MDPVQAGITEKRAFLRFAEKWFWPKNGFYPKKSPKMTFPPLIIWAKALFFFEQLFPVVARTWLESKSDRLFLGPKFRFLAKKSDFCHTTPILVNGPSVALGETAHFPPWEQFFPVVARTWLEYRSDSFFSAQNFGFWPKNLIFAIRPQFWSMTHF